VVGPSARIACCCLAFSAQEIPVRGFAATLVSILLLTTLAPTQQPALAQPDQPPAAAPGAEQAQPPTAGEQQTMETLKNDPAVQQSQDPQPTAQGTRAPNETNTDTRSQELSRLLWQIWNEPVDLQGNPIVKQAGQPTTPGPAAATAEGCGTTSHDLATRPAASPSPCPSASDAPAPP
jgi:hypothetical protein